MNRRPASPAAIPGSIWRLEALCRLSQRAVDAQPSVGPDQDRPTECVRYRPTQALDIESFSPSSHSCAQEITLMAIIQRPKALTGRHRQLRATDPVARFVRGEIGRRQAMAALGGIDYAALLSSR